MRLPDDASKDALCDVLRESFDSHEAVIAFASEHSIELNVTEVLQATSGTAYVDAIKQGNEVELAEWFTVQAPLEEDLRDSPLEGDADPELLFDG